MALENVYYACHLFSSPISSEWSQWLLCVTLEKLKDMNIFLAPSIEKAQTKNGWLIESRQHSVMKSQCDSLRA